MGETELVTLSECTSIGITGTLGLQAASAYWGMSTYDYTALPIFIFQVEGTDVAEYHSIITYVGIPREINNGHLVDISNKYGDGITVTDKPQTVVDMILCDCDLYHTLETIDYYYTYEGIDAIKQLEELADRYGVLDKLKKLVLESETIYDE